VRPLVDRLRSRAGAFLHDSLMVPLAWLGAYWLRFNLGPIPEPYWGAALHALLLVWPLQVALSWAFGLYRGVWRFASLPDLIRILKAVLSGVALTLGALFVVNRLQGIPRSLPLLYGLSLGILLAGPRLAYRWWRDRRIHLGNGRRVLIVGAGSAGEALVRDLARDPGRAYLPVGFVDDKPRRQGGEIQGLPIFGDCERLPALAPRLGIDLIVIAIPSADAAQMRRLVALCERTGLPFRTLPAVADLVGGRVDSRALRPVSIEDLLGREPVVLDHAALARGLAGRRILVTGGGGSIGSELCRQLAALGPSRLILLEQSEYNLYRIEMELREGHPDLPLEPLLGDVTDSAALAHLFARTRPEVVFHAAAYKHVPLLEPQIREAVRVNVLGTHRVARAALDAGCREFVLISTDKAVNPANVMGASKRAAERLCMALAGGATRFVTVRFGNVLGSAGSVVPLFRRQLEAGGPLTLTHPDMERYFMTIPEACQLIMQGGVMGRGGEIFVLDMGEPVRIRYLAEQMIRLAGRDPEEIGIREIGLRPGEKLYEELFYAGEDLAPTHHPRIRVARHAQAGVTDWPQRVAALERAVADCDPAALERELRGLVPEWGAAGERPGALARGRGPGEIGPDPGG